MKSKIAKIFLDDSGSFLGRGEGCLIVSDKKRNVEKYPLFENQVGEVQVKIGNSISSGALATCAFWDIDLLILTQRGNPVAYLKSLDDDSHVETRVCQYESLKNGKGIEIAKKIVVGKLEGQDKTLQKYGMKRHDIIRIKKTINDVKSDSIQEVRRKLTGIEGKFSDFYWKQVFQLMPKAILKTDRRRTFRAYDGLNNTFNLAYTVLKWKVLRAINRAKLEPFLGFVHSEQFSKPSLVCDLMELYRFLVDDFLVQFAKNLRKKDFSMNVEKFSSNKKGKREYLNKPLAELMMKKLTDYFQSTVEIPRVKVGKRQEIESLLN
jgi:CRISPR-associated protein Cas1